MKRIKTETFEKIKDDLYVVGIDLTVVPTFELPLGIVKTLAEEPWEQEFDSAATFVQYFREPVHLHEFARLYDGAGKDFKIRDDRLDIRLKLRLETRNPSNPDGGVSRSFLMCNSANLVPVQSGIPDLELYVKTYFRERFVEGSAKRDEDILRGLFPDAHPAE